MNNAPVIICLLMCIGFGIYSLYLRNLERTPAPYHLMHGPNDGCVECEGR